MSDVTESTDLPAVAGPGPNLAQVDPPHPFKSALKTIAIRCGCDVQLRLGCMLTWDNGPRLLLVEVLSATVYPVHSLTNNGGSHDSGMAGSTEYSDQVLIPLQSQDSESDGYSAVLCRNIGLTIKLPDGTEMVNVSASDKDMDRVFIAYPSLAYLRSTSDSTGRDAEPWTVCGGG